VNFLDAPGKKGGKIFALAWGESRNGAGGKKGKSVGLEYLGKPPQKRCILKGGPVHQWCRRSLLQGKGKGKKKGGGREEIE